MNDTSVHSYLMVEVDNVDCSFKHRLWR